MAARSLGRQLLFHELLSRRTWSGRRNSRGRNEIRVGGCRITINWSFLPDIRAPLCLRSFVLSGFSSFPPPPYSEKVLETARISKILSNRDNREESCVVDAPTIYRAIPSKYTRSTGLTRIELIGGARFERNTSGNTSEEDGYIKVS